MADMENQHSLNHKGHNSVQDLARNSNAVVSEENSNAGLWCESKETNISSIMASDAHFTLDSRQHEGAGSWDWAVTEVIAVTTKKYYREGAALMGAHCPQAPVQRGVYPQTTLHVKWDLVTTFLQSASYLYTLGGKCSTDSLYKSVRSVPDFDLQELSKE